MTGAILGLGPIAILIGLLVLGRSVHRRREYAKAREAARDQIHEHFARDWQVPKRFISGSE